MLPQDCNIGGTFVAPSSNALVSLHTLLLVCAPRSALCLTLLPHAVRKSHIGYHSCRIPCSTQYESQIVGSVYEQVRVAYSALQVTVLFARISGTLPSTVVQLAALTMFMLNDLKCAFVQRAMHSLPPQDLRNPPSKCRSAQGLPLSSQVNGLHKHPAPTRILSGATNPVYVSGKELVRAT